MIRKKIRVFVVGGIAFVGIWFGMLTDVKAQTVDDLKLMTEAYPPFNFRADGQIRGIASDLIVLMLERSGSKLNRDAIDLLPWVRGYRAVQSQKNTCLFSTTRSEEREKLFKWVGPIAPTVVALIARRDRNIQINSIDEMKKYKIGVVRDDIGEQLLVKAGLSRASLEQVTDAKANILKLSKGRIDLFSYEESVTKWSLKASGLNPSEYETVYVLEQGEVYYALNKNTPESLIQKLQKALDEIKKNGDYQKIMDKYLK